MARKLRRRDLSILLDASGWQSIPDQNHKKPKSSFDRKTKKLKTFQHTDETRSNSGISMADVYQSSREKPVKVQLISEMDGITSGKLLTSVYTYNTKGMAHVLEKSW